MSKLACQWQGAGLDGEWCWRFSDQVHPFYHPLNVKLPNSQRCLFWQLLKENKSKVKQSKPPNQPYKQPKKIRKKKNAPKERSSCFSCYQSIFPFFTQI